MSAFANLELSEKRSSSVYKNDIKQISIKTKRTTFNLIDHAQKKSLKITEIQKNKQKTKGIFDNYI